MSWIITQRRGFNRQSGSCVFKVCTSFWSRFTHNHTTTTTTHDPDTCTHTQSTRQDLPVFVLLEEEETSRDKELVILLFVYVSIAENLTAVILLKQTDGCRESQEKSPSFPSSTHRSIYIPIFHCLLRTVNRRRRKLQFSYIDDNMW